MSAVGMLLIASGLGLFADQAVMGRPEAFETLAGLLLVLGGTVLFLLGEERPRRRRGDDSSITPATDEGNRFIVPARVDARYASPDPGGG